MKKVLFVMALALTMVGCGQKTAQGGDADSTQVTDDTAPAMTDAELTQVLLGEWINSDTDEKATAVAFELSEDNGELVVSSCGVYGANYEYDAVAKVENGSLTVEAEGFYADLKHNGDDQLVGNYILTIPDGPTEEGFIVMKRGW